MERPIRVAIVGAGAIAWQRHGPGYLDLARSGGLKIVGVADVDPAAAARLARVLGTEAFPSLAQLLDRARPHALSVCVPNRFHAESTIHALEAGVHVLCEKPPAVTVEEAEAMAEAAERNRRTLLYGMLYRHAVPWAPRFVPELGDIYLAKAKWLRRRGIPAQPGFTSKAVQGGGAFIDLGVHVVDLAWYLMGRPRPLRVGGTMYAHIGTTTEVGLLGPVDRTKFEVEDTALGAIMCAGQRRLQFEAAYASNQRRRESMQVTLVGANATLSVRLMTTQTRATRRFCPTMYGERHAHLLDTVIAEPRPPTVEEAWRLQMAHFVACVRGEVEPIAGPRDGVELQRMIAAFYESAAGTDRVVLGVE
jgi:predicted dehydrogenase